MEEVVTHAISTARFAGALAFAVGGLLVPASPAGAHCSGHGIHPDRYSGGGIQFKEGTRIRAYPHKSSCSTVLGLGYPGHGIDVHCAVKTSDLYVWFFLVDTTTGARGWSRSDAVAVTHQVRIDDCVQPGPIWVIG